MGLFCGVKGTPTAQTNTPTSHGVRSPPVNRFPTPSTPSTQTDLTTTTAQIVSPAHRTAEVQQLQSSSVRGSADNRRDQCGRVTSSESDQISVTPRKVFENAFKKYYSENSPEKTSSVDSDGIMELLNGGANATKTSPVLTIKRGGRLAGQWQDFTDREQSSVDQLIKDSFAVFCRDMNENNDIDVESKLKYQRRNSSESNNRPNMSSLPRTNKLFLARSISNGGAGTLPRAPASKMDGSMMTTPRLPKGIEELELLYAPMKNLTAPLPNARKYSGSSMPQPHPLFNSFDLRNELKIVEDFERRRVCDDDQVINPIKLPIKPSFIFCR